MKTSLLSRFTVAAVLLTLPGVAARPAAGQDLPAGAPSFLVGSWLGEGELMGRAATFRMTWEAALGGRHLRMTFQNAFVGPDGGEQVVLRSEALHTPMDAGWVASWFDTRGKRLDLTGDVIEGGSAYRVVWVDPGIEEGVTVYRATDDGGLAVVDSVLSADGYRLFGHATYVREGDAVGLRVTAVTSHPFRQRMGYGRSPETAGPVFAGAAGRFGLGSEAFSGDYPYSSLGLRAAVDRQVLGSAALRLQSGVEWIPEKRVLGLQTGAGIVLRAREGFAMVVVADIRTFRVPFEVSTAEYGEGRRVSEIRRSEPEWRSQAGVRIGLEASLPG